MTVITIMTMFKRLESRPGMVYLECAGFREGFTFLNNEVDLEHTATEAKALNGTVFT